MSYKNKMYFNRLIYWSNILALVNKLVLKENFFMHIKDLQQWLEL